ncbi:MAG: hypothetical protein U0470_08045 [Anaerolineae bacterium]
MPVARLMRLERFADGVGTDRGDQARADADTQAAGRPVLLSWRADRGAGQLGRRVPQNVARSIDDGGGCTEMIVVHQRAVLVQTATNADGATGGQRRPRGGR